MSSAMIVDNFPVMEKSKQLVVKLKRCRLIVDSTTMIQGQTSSQQELHLVKPKEEQCDHEMEARIPSMEDNHVVLSSKPAQPERSHEESDTTDHHIDESQWQQDCSNTSKRARLDAIVMKLQLRLPADSLDKVTDSDVTDPAVFDIRHNQRDVDLYDEPCTTSRRSRLPMDDLKTSHVHENLNASMRPDINKVETTSENKQVVLVQPSISTNICRDVVVHSSVIAAPQHFSTMIPNNMVQVSASYTNARYAQARSQIYNHGQCVNHYSRTVATFPMALNNSPTRHLQFAQPSTNCVYCQNNLSVNTPHSLWPSIDTNRRGYANQLQNYSTYSQFQPIQSAPYIVPVLAHPTTNTNVILPWSQQFTYPNVVVPCSVSPARHLVRTINRT